MLTKWRLWRQSSILKSNEVVIILAYLTGDYELVDLYWCIGVERREPGTHLIDEYTHRPPVNAVIVALTTKHSE